MMWSTASLIHWIRRVLTRSCHVGPTECPLVSQGDIDTLDMQEERFMRPMLTTKAQYLIHEHADGTSCVTEKPQLRLTCGACDVLWTPPPASTWHRRRFVSAAPLPT